MRLKKVLYFIQRNNKSFSVNVIENKCLMLHPIVTNIAPLNVVLVELLEDIIIKLILTTM